jgi:hypothetical protein
LVSPKIANCLDFDNAIRLAGFGCDNGVFLTMIERRQQIPFGDDNKKDDYSKAQAGIAPGLYRYAFLMVEDFG